MSSGRMSAALLTALGALLAASPPAADGVTPVGGAYSGATAAGVPFSMSVEVKKPGPKLRPRFKRLASVGHVRAAVPISCRSGEQRSESVGFPGPLHVGRIGRFGVRGIARSRDGERVTTKVTGRFTGRRKASGTLSYRGGFDGEFCKGEVAWKASRGGANRAALAPAGTIRVDCATRPQVLGRVPPPQPRDVVIANVAFSDLKARGREKPSTFRVQRWTPVKAAFKVPARVEVATLSIAPRDRTGARFLVGFEKAPHERDAGTVELRPCPRSDGPRTAFLGGFRVRGPRCVKVRVTTATASEAKRVAFGRGTCSRG
jgi:hypothetical protein